MTDSKLKAGLWVKAQLRICDIQNLPAVVLKKGDADAGTILIRVERGQGRAILFTQARDGQGRLGWAQSSGAEPVEAAAADAAVARQIQRDPDLWVLEVEDRAGTFQPEGLMLN